MVTLCQSTHIFFLEPLVKSHQRQNLHAVKEACPPHYLTQRTDDISTNQQKTNHAQEFSTNKHHPLLPCPLLAHSTHTFLPTNVEIIAEQKGFQFPFSFRRAPPTRPHFNAIGPTILSNSPLLLKLAQVLTYLWSHR